MPSPSPRLVVAGSDTHAQTHHVAVLDAFTGVVLGDQEFPATRAGYQAVVAFIATFGVVLRIGVEGTNSYGAGLTRHLRAASIEVAEVIRPNRAERRLKGKSDPLDAVTAAKTVLAAGDLPTPKSSDGVIESIRVLLITRNSAIKARTAVLCQIKMIMVSAPAELREILIPLKDQALLERLRRSRPGTSLDTVDTATMVALRRLARRHAYLTEEIDEAFTELETLVQQVAPALLATRGVGPITASQLLITVGDNPDRITGEAAFAALCGTSPIPASSGKTNRHRLNRGGDRQANSAIHQIVLSRASNDRRTQAYLAKKQAEGKSTRDAIRSLKRIIARELYKTITNPPDIPRIDDLRPLRQARGMTLQTVADHFGVWPTHISTIERGKRRDDDLANRYREWLETA